MPKRYGEYTNPVEFEVEIKVSRVYKVKVKTRDQKNAIQHGHNLVERGQLKGVEFISRVEVTATESLLQPFDC